MPYGDGFSVYEKRACDACGRVTHYRYHESREAFLCRDCFKHLVDFDAREVLEGVLKTSADPRSEVASGGEMPPYVPLVPDEVERAVERLSGGTYTPPPEPEEGETSAIDRFFSWAREKGREVPTDPVEMGKLMAEYDWEQLSSLNEEELALALELGHLANDALYELRKFNLHSRASGERTLSLLPASQEGIDALGAFETVLADFLDGSRLSKGMRVSPELRPPSREAGKKILVCLTVLKLFASLAAKRVLPDNVEAMALRVKGSLASLADNSAATGRVTESAQNLLHSIGQTWLPEPSRFLFDLSSLEEAEFFLSWVAEAVARLAIPRL